MTVRKVSSRFGSYYITSKLDEGSECRDTVEDKSCFSVVGKG